MYTFLSGLLSKYSYISIPQPSLQELSQNRRVLCATVVLDRGVEALQQRVSNKLYEGCRNGDLQIAGFPDYKPLLAGLQQVAPEESGSTYQVCVKRHDKLLVLSMLAEKFLNIDELKDQAHELITKHNEAFNENGDFMAEAEPERTPLVQFHMDSLKTKNTKKSIPFMFVSSNHLRFLAQQSPFIPSQPCQDIWR